MDGNRHMLFGGTVGIMSAINIDLISQTFPNITPTTETQTLFILGCIAGSILPDIDSYNSHTGKLFYPIPQLIDAVLKVDGRDRFKHRGITHSVLIYAFLLAYAYNNIPSIIGLLIGCITHLFLDAFNPQGIPLMSMVIDTKIKFANIKSGGTASTVLTIILMAVVIAIGVRFKVKGSVF